MTKYSEGGNRIEVIGNDPATQGIIYREYRDYTEFTTVRTVTATPWVECARTNCFCCSCANGDSYTTQDPYCRNHNYGFGMRPCEYHNMPGEPCEDPETGVREGFPDSVQKAIRDRKEAELRAGAGMTGRGE